MFSGVVSTFMFLHALKNNSLTRTELFGVLAMVTSNLFRSWRAPFSVWTELGHGQQEERTKGSFFFGKKQYNLMNSLLRLQFFLTESTRHLEAVHFLWVAVDVFRDKEMKKGQCKKTRNGFVGQKGKNKMTLV